MNRMHNQAVITVTACSAIPVAGGCLANRIDLVERGIVTVERKQDRHLQFPWVGVYMEKDEVVVSGSIRRLPLWRVPVRGLVAVQLLGPTGEILEEVEASYSPRSIPTKGTRSSRFSLQLNTIPPAGSIVRVQYRARPRDPVQAKAPGARRD